MGTKEFPASPLPPLPVKWRGAMTTTTALRGQASLLFFPCDQADCERCRAEFAALRASRDLDYWEVRRLWVAGAGREGSSADAAADAIIMDVAGRCRAWLQPEAGGAPGWAVLDGWLEVRDRRRFPEHGFLPVAEVESGLRRILMECPECGVSDWGPSLVVPPTPGEEPASQG